MATSLLCEGAGTTTSAGKARPFWFTVTSSATRSTTTEDEATAFCPVLLHFFSLGLSAIGSNIRFKVGVTISAESMYALLGFIPVQLYEKLKSKTLQIMYTHNPQSATRWTEQCGALRENDVLRENVVLHENDVLRAKRILNDYIFMQSSTYWTKHNNFSKFNHPILNRTVCLMRTIVSWECKSHDSDPHTANLPNLARILPSNFGRSKTKIKVKSRSSHGTETARENDVFRENDQCSWERCFEPHHREELPVSTNCQQGQSCPSVQKH